MDGQMPQVQRLLKAKTNKKINQAIVGWWGGSTFFTLGQKNL